MTFSFIFKCNHLRKLACNSDGDKVIHNYFCFPSSTQKGAGPLKQIYRGSFEMDEGKLGCSDVPWWNRNLQPVLDTGGVFLEEG